MRTPRAPTFVGLALVVIAFGALVGVSLNAALVYYVTPSELEANHSSDPVRLYGIVVPDSVRWQTTTAVLSFRVTDGTTSVAVESGSLPTGLFRDGIGVVLAGRLVTPGRFVADEVLVKHSEVYGPLRPGETMPPDLLEQIRAGSS